MRNQIKFDGEAERGRQREQVYLFTLAVVT